LIKDSKNAYFSLESKSTASHNIVAWDRMMTSYNLPKNRPPSWVHWPKTPIQIKNFFFYSKLHDATSHYRVWTAL